MTDTTHSARSGETGEIWILGARGRIGGAVVAHLAAQGLKPVLVGREGGGDRLRDTAADLGTRAVVVDGVDGMAAEITRQRPAVVLNGIGNYAETASVLARACMPGGHYLDLAADLTAVPLLLDLHEEAERAGSTLVTGSGFGVLATEAVVIRLCEGRPAPAAVRVDALASVSSTPESSAPPSPPR
ncbi:saccharopine dehydrogenase NADP-binding domain-containing protein [Streptomyces olivaceus]|uniref:saccharopine dehydrogenase NADP-binding domain-containing protein n=1 Tax=Streptomyces olivaceus TaxID=47716 RepID=UPI0033D0E715